jgi:uncharacterized protein (DUF885 family)
MLLAAVRRLDKRSLSPEDRIDAVLLDDALRYELWRHDRLQEWAWDIQRYQDLTRDALSNLPQSDAAAPRERILGAAERFKQMPAFFARIRTLTDPARVPAPHAKLVADQNRHLLDGVVEPLERDASRLAAADRRSFEAAVTVLRAAVARQQLWLDSELVPHATGSFRLGAALYDTKARFEMGTALSRPQIEAKARAAIVAIRARMYAVARRVLEGRPDAPSRPLQPTNAEEETAIRASLALAEIEHPTGAQFVPVIRSTLAQSTDFVRKANLVAVPDDTVAIVDMPADMQGIVPAFFQHQGVKSVYAVSPIPADWDEARVDEYLRAHNNYYLQNLTIHEAMPGHYLQSVHQQANAFRLRQALGSRSFAEGWAVYTQQMMVDQGYLADKPLFELTELQWRLGSACSALLDIGIQTEGWTRQQVIDLLVGTCFQRPSEAVARWDRASLTSTQLLTYFVGYSEHVALRDEIKRREGASFDLRAYNDAVLSHGMPPVRLLRTILIKQATR